MKRIVKFYIILLGVCTLLSGCNSSDLIRENSTKRQHKFGATYMTMNNPFFEVMNDNIKSRVESNGDVLITRDPALSIEKQIEQMNEFIDMEVEVIFLNPVDWKEIKPVLERAHEAGIPIINLDTAVYDKEFVTSIIESDNYDAGVQCAKDMMERISYGNIAILEHPSAKSAIDRTQSFADTIKNKRQYRIIDRESSEGQLEHAMPAAEKILARQKEIDVFMSLNDPTALGVFAALQIYHPDKQVLIYGVDGSPETKKLIKDGLMTATAAQSPKKMGNKAVDIAYDILAGKNVEEHILIPVTLITRENVEHFDLNGWQ